MKNIRTVIRIKKDLKQQLKEEAESKKISLNQLIVEKLEQTYID